MLYALHEEETESLTNQTMLVNVDVDAMDPDFIKSLPITPHDMTSNQIHVHGQMSEPKNRQLLLDVAREYKDRSWVDVYTRVVSLSLGQFCFLSRPSLQE